MTSNKELNINESVISFYCLKGEDANRLSPSEAWRRITKGNSTDIYCMNIFSFDMSAEDLKDKFRNLDKFNMFLLQDIRNEYENDLANFMFISPESGKPVEGFYIEDFLKKFD